MTQRELVDTVAVLHQEASMRDILDAMCSVCLERARTEEKDGNTTGSQAYSRAAHLLATVDFLFV